MVEKKGIRSGESHLGQGRVAPAGEGRRSRLDPLRLPTARHDGLAVLKWAQDHNLRIPFIVMTSYAEVQNAVLAMKAGATDYIAKPFQPDILLEKIQEALRALMPP